MTIYLELFVTYPQQTTVCVSLVCIMQGLYVFKTLCFNAMPMQCHQTFCDTPLSNWYLRWFLTSGKYQNHIKSRYYNLNSETYLKHPHAFSAIHYKQSMQPSFAIYLRLIKMPHLVPLAFVNSLWIDHSLGFVFCFRTSIIMRLYLLFTPCWCHHATWWNRFIYTVLPFQWLSPFSS